MRRGIVGLMMAVVAAVILAGPGPAGAGNTPGLTIDDVTQVEGDAGTTVFTFTVSLTSFNNQVGVTFDIVTAAGAAVAPGDYTAKALVGFIPFPLTTYEFDVEVNGDTAVELDENFFVNVANCVGCFIQDSQGEGTIVNDDGVYPPVITPQAGGSSQDQDAAAVQTALDASVEAERTAALEAQRTNASSPLPSSPGLLAMVAVLALVPVVVVGVLRRRMLRRL